MYLENVEKTPDNEIFLKVLQQKQQFIEKDHRHHIIPRRKGLESQPKPQKFSEIKSKKDILFEKDIGGDKSGEDEEEDEKGDQGDGGKGVEGEEKEESKEGDQDNGSDEEEGDNQSHGNNGNNEGYGGDEDDESKEDDEFDKGNSEGLESDEGYGGDEEDDVYNDINSRYRYTKCRVM